VNRKIYSPHSDRKTRIYLFHLQVFFLLGLFKIAKMYNRNTSQKLTIEACKNTITLFYHITTCWKLSKHDLYKSLCTEACILVLKSESMSYVLLLDHVGDWCYGSML
jgi:hypothetical protein